jgi:hypothetical protein
MKQMRNSGDRVELADEFHGSVEKGRGGKGHQAMSKTLGTLLETSLFEFRDTANYVNGILFSLVQVFHLDMKLPP